MCTCLCVGVGVGVYLRVYVSLTSSLCASCVQIAAAYDISTVKVCVRYKTE